MQSETENIVRFLGQILEYHFRKDLQEGMMNYGNQEACG